MIALLFTQGTAPLRKSDLVRLLSAAEISSAELEQLVRRNCLTFDPTERDRNDFRLMGGDAAMLAAVDDCARRQRSRRTAAVTPVHVAVRRPASPPAAPPAPPPPPQPTTSATQPPVVLQIQRIVVRVSAERTGFVAGGGQRGAGGVQSARALVFEGRASTGAPLSG